MSQNPWPTLLLSGLVALAGPAQAADAVLETVPASEAREIDETAGMMVELQDLRAKNEPEQQGRLLRGVHPKSHGCVRAEFVVNADIAADYQVGLFAEPGQRHEAWIRYSNAAALREDDLKADRSGQRGHGSRGMALKIMDVEGEFLDTDNGRQNQDFLMINTPQFAFADVRSYLRLNKVLLLSPKGDVADPFFAPLRGPPAVDETPFGKIWVGFGDADKTSTASSAAVIGKIKQSPVGNPLQAQYFGAAPFLFGEDRAMKVSVAPCQPVVASPLQITPTSPPENYLRDALTETMQGTESICLDFKLQTRTQAELTKMPSDIEDATTLWEGEAERYLNVARITIPAPQTPDSAESLEHCEKLAFTPWHSLAAHRPIGGINRVRQSVYHSSAQHRGADGY